VTPLFADTFYFLAVINPDDSCHQDALTLSAANEAPLLTTAWILAEVADALAETANRRLSRQLYFDLRDDPVNIVVPPSIDSFERGFSLYHNRLDKGWSLTDCISFLVMEDHGISEALTGDHHFEQAGFRPLLA
jgi:uncharacterized protein